MITLTIQRLDGSTQTNHDIDFAVDDIQVSLPTMSNTTETIAGRHGNIDLGSTLDPREVFVTGYFKSYDKDSFKMYRDRIAKLFVSTEAFYLIDSRQPWKRWLVKQDGSWEANRIRFHNVGEVEATFTTMGLPYATSAATSLQPRIWQDNGWFWGSGIEWSNEDFVYDTTTFVVPNWGDVAVNPRFMDLIIRFNGQSSNLRIRNLTTGNDWRYTGTTVSTDQIVIDGIRSTKNGTSIIRNTNKQLITLAPGNNSFQIDGVIGSSSIIFEFRFAYL